MNKIGIDARLIFQTGVGTYLQNLLYYIDQKNSKKEEYYVYLKKDDYPKVTFKSKNLIKRIADQKWHTIAEQINFLGIINRDKLDLMHFTYFSYPMFYSRKFVATVHDTTPLYFKTGKASTKNPFIYQIKHFFFQIILYFQIHRSDRIITPTQSVKNELVKIFGRSIENKIIPVYEGVNYKIFNTKENRQLESKYKNFFIYVGNFYPHKNVEKLIDSFAELTQKYKLLLIGPNDFFASRILDYIKSKKLDKRVIFVASPPLPDLLFFYKHAEALIHPSLSEGFGLPLIEAAYFNTPIIASNINVFKELLNSDFISFNPKDKEDIVRKINYFINKRPIFDYKNIIKKYSFTEMTDKTLKIYQSITQNS